MKIFQSVTLGVRQILNYFIRESVIAMDQKESMPAGRDRHLESRTRNDKFWQTFWRFEMKSFWQVPRQSASESVSLSIKAIVRIIVLYSIWDVYESNEIKYSFKVK